MIEALVGTLLILLYGSILILMITVSYKKYKKLIKRRYKAEMKSRLKLIKGEKVGE